MKKRVNASICPARGLRNGHVLVCKQTEKKIVLDLFYAFQTLTKESGASFFHFLGINFNASSAKV